MNFNITWDITVEKYKKHLSPFGCKVLSVLLQQRLSPGNKYLVVSSRDSNSNNSYYLYNNKGNIDNVIDNITNSCYPDTNDEMDFTDINVVSPETNTKAIPKSVELVRSAHKELVPQNSQNIVPFDHIVKPPIFNTIPKVYSLLNDKDDLLNKQIAENTVTDFSGPVPWEDMFDSELFPKNDEAKNLACDKAAKKTNVVKTFEITFPEKIQKDCDNKMEFKNNSEKNPKKHKNKTNFSEKVPKKVKKAVKEFDSLAKPSFRKEKYTKTVKNWLNGVDPKHVVDEINILENTSDGMNKLNRVELTIEDNLCGDRRKKTVQAQLSNVNGVMKYSKPSKNENEHTNKTEKQGPPASEANKEKKKSKFVAPIKSQIPVKDITYKVFTLDNDNDYFDENTSDLRSSATEIFMTLIYSNDYCQLNNHYTEDVGVPQGIMFLVKDNFYYLGGSLSKHKGIIRHLINNNSVVCYEGKNLLTHFFQYLGSDVSKDIKILDAKIGGSLLDPDNPPNNFSELQKLLTYEPEYTIATDCLQQKSAWYISLLKECWDKLQQSLVAQGLWNIFVEIEMRVMPIISGMEHRGVSVDLETLKCMEKLLLEKMKTVEQECYKAAGKTFQINSAVQVRVILYDELKLDSKCNVKIRETICKGAKSTSEVMLRSLIHKHILPKLILEYRHLHKAHATFLSGIAQCVRGGVVKPLWEQTAAATGRISCNSPNLQAVPKTPFSLTLFPREGAVDDAQTLNLRSLYVGRSGHYLLAADFKQMECRVFALAAADNSLLQALSSPDLFRVLSAAWLNKPESEVTNEERERTKRVVYASMYGAGVNKLADVLGLGYEHALSVVTSFNRTFPSLKSFGRAVVSRCERDGRLSTPCGRTRYFKDITSTDFTTKAQAERKAINFIIQGSAADLCKMAMVKAEQHLRNSDPPIDAYLLLQIHDELVWEVRDEDLSRAAELIKSAMEGCGYECGMPMVLPVALSYGRNWGEMKEYVPEV
ncbi:unnamed protein product [Parnassius mnemosyne]|uniref:DNA-directed DNA polymerase family A palm domain-containing protein n=1 Tax=Parnassius mnemosyne TaxID=213953 RepID=A0AAV1LKN4_9NEOP